MKKLEIYTTLDGKCPFKEWMSGLSNNYQSRIDIRLKRIKQGNFGDHKRLQNSELSELRFDFGKGYRVYCKELNNAVVLLIAGSGKSNQNTVIKQAEKYLIEFQKRSENNG